MSLIVGVSVLVGIVVIVAALVVTGRTGEPSPSEQPEVEAGSPPPVRPDEPIPGSRPHREQQGRT
jgi:FlaG/FlaF family flagellin (archaellin)